MLVEAAELPAWLAALVARLDATPTVELAVYALGIRSRAPKPALLSLYERIDRRLFRRHPDALDPVEVAAHPAPAGFEGHDVVLDFASSEPVSYAAGVRFGVWTLTHGPSDTGLYQTRIDTHAADGRRASLYTSYGAVDPASAHRTRNEALWKASGAFAHRVETVRRLGHAFVESRPASTEPTVVATPPSNLAVATRALRAASGVVARRLRRLRAREAWFVATRPRDGSRVAGLDRSLAGFVPIEVSSQSAVADPFVVEDGGETYVFFEDEDVRTGKGDISFVRLDADARPLAPPRRALTRPYHLSYPFVFRHEDEMFMIPESGANRTVELYRASRFPTDWTLEAVLLNGIYAVDATLHVDGRMWLFVGVAQEGSSSSDELHVYSSTSLTGPWEAHPANPVVSDVRCARPAGRIFRHGGALIRPSQDSSRRYGFAIVLNRIDVLTADDYAETSVARIEPDWHPAIFATHTLTFGDRVEAIDGQRLVPTRFGGRLFR
jgi:hypothetical protein